MDVFSPNSEWSGFYEYLGKRQATAFTVIGFNDTSGRVNITLLEASGVSIRLSGKTRKEALKAKFIIHVHKFALSVVREELVLYFQTV